MGFLKNEFSWQTSKTVLMDDDISISKIGKKVQFQKYKRALFAFSKMARNQFLQPKKV